MRPRLNPAHIATRGLTPSSKQSAEFWLSLRAGDSSRSEEKRVSLCRVMLKKIIEFTLIFSSFKPFSWFYNYNFGGKNGTRC